MQQNSVIEKLISELALSQNFKEMSFAHDFRTLVDILNWPVSVLLMHPDFTFHHFQELRGFLKKNELLHLLKSV